MPSFGITGTPGTGKKTIAPLVAKHLHLVCRSLNELAAANGLVSDDQEVDTKRLGRIVGSDLNDRTLLYGHLLPEVVTPRLLSRVVVLRCEPMVLKSRLVRRHYEREKVTENVEAELIGLISADSQARFGSESVSDVDTTATVPAESAAWISQFFEFETPPKAQVDWLPKYATPKKLASLLSSD